MCVKVIDRRTGPADMDGERKSGIADRFIKREQERIVQLAVSGRAQYHHGRRSEPFHLAHFMGGR